ncbi:MAG TPA: Rne/Rng family ribonuclease, partial [Candidatus Angelobacter sp.]|nr:Rne/Rng family ribonuclease [Candidatus Angelobacter sp.]
EAVSEEPNHAESSAEVFSGTAVASSHSPESAETAGHSEAASQSRGAWYAPSAGVVEEEEIEEEEGEFPTFEERLDLADDEELEEEVLEVHGDQMLPVGSQLTEAVRDAHVNEHATGAYEAEGLEEEELEDGADGLHAELAGEEDTEDGLEAVSETESPEGARAEQRASSGTAGYQQRTERTGDRQSRRPGRRMRGRPQRQFVQRHTPVISDLLKEGQEILVQIAKEPIAKKGARITSHIALPGRFLVYMPTVHHTGVSRKIASDEERQRLKRIVLSERGESHGGFIVRTAAAGANEDDLRADIRFLINLWNEIRGRAETSKAPSLLYHDLNLVERILRDQVTTSFSSIWVDTEVEYERIVRFVSRFQPSMLKRVKLYTKETPLFEQFSITDEINKALKSKVWLKSGGYIVINQTEALVAIDINTGKFVGKTSRLEDTIVKTNIDAVKEIVRQVRLRDLGGIIVIDFIDMDERKNRQKVMQALEEALKADRAPSKVLQFNDFGLVAITRKRVKQSLERTLGQPCPTCAATGMIKSVSTVCNEIYVEMRKMSRHLERDVMLRVNPEVAKTLKGSGARWLQELEEVAGQTVIVKSDPLLHPEHFDIQ